MGASVSSSSGERGKNGGSDTARRSRTYRGGLWANSSSTTTTSTAVDSLSSNSSSSITATPVDGESLSNSNSSSSAQFSGESLSDNSSSSTPLDRESLSNSSSSSSGGRSTQRNARASRNTGRSNTPRRRRRRRRSSSSRSNSRRRRANSSGNRTQGSLSFLTSVWGVVNLRRVPTFVSACEGCSLSCHSHSSPRCCSSARVRDFSSSISCSTTSTGAVLPPALSRRHSPSCGRPASSSSGSSSSMSSSSMSSGNSASNSSGNTHSHADDKRSSRTGSSNRRYRLLWNDGEGMPMWSSYVSNTAAKAFSVACSAYLARCYSLAPDAAAAVLLSLPLLHSFPFIFRDAVRLAAQKGCNSRRAREEQQRQHLTGSRPHNNQKKSSAAAAAEAATESREDGGVAEDFSAAAAGPSSAAAVAATAASPSPAAAAASSPMPAAAAPLTKGGVAAVPGRGAAASAVFEADTRHASSAAAAAVKLPAAAVAPGGTACEAISAAAAGTTADATPSAAVRPSECEQREAAAAAARCLPREQWKEEQQPQQQQRRQQPEEEQGQWHEMQQQQQQQADEQQQQQPEQPLYGYPEGVCPCRQESGCNLSSACSSNNLAYLSAAFSSVSAVVLAVLWLLCLAQRSSQSLGTAAAGGGGGEAAAAAANSNIDVEAVQETADAWALRAAVVLYCCAALIEAAGEPLLFIFLLGQQQQPLSKPQQQEMLLRPREPYRQREGRRKEQEEQQQQHRGGVGERQRQEQQQLLQLSLFRRRRKQQQQHAEGQKAEQDDVGGWQRQRKQDGRQTEEMTYQARETPKEEEEHPQQQKVRHIPGCASIGAAAEAAAIVSRALALVLLLQHQHGRREDLLQKRQPPVMSSPAGLHAHHIGGVLQQQARERLLLNEQQQQPTAAVLHPPLTPLSFVLVLLHPLVAYGLAQLVYAVVYYIYLLYACRQAAAAGAAGVCRCAALVVSPAAAAPLPSDAFAADSGRCAVAAAAADDGSRAAEDPPAESAAAAELLADTTRAAAASAAACGAARGSVKYRAAAAAAAGSDNRNSAAWTCMSSSSSEETLGNKSVNDSNTYRSSSSYRSQSTVWGPFCCCSSDSCWSDKSSNTTYSSSNMGNAPVGRQYLRGLLRLFTGRCAYCGSKHTKTQRKSSSSNNNNSNSNSSRTACSSPTNSSSTGDRGGRSASWSCRRRGDEGAVGCRSLSRSSSSSHPTLCSRKRSLLEEDRSICREGGDAGWPRRRKRVVTQRAYDSSRSRFRRLRTGSNSSLRHTGSNEEIPQQERSSRCRSGGVVSGDNSSSGNSELLGWQYVMSRDTEAGKDSPAVAGFAAPWVKQQKHLLRLTISSSLFRMPIDRLRCCLHAARCLFTATAAARCPFTAAAAARWEGFVQRLLGEEELVLLWMHLRVVVQHFLIGEGEKLLLLLCLPSTAARDYGFAAAAVAAVTRLVCAPVQQFAVDAFSSLAAAACSLEREGDAAEEAEAAEVVPGARAAAAVVEEGVGGTAAAAEVERGFGGTAEAGTRLEAPAAPEKEEAEAAVTSGAGGVTLAANSASPAREAARERASSGRQEGGRKRGQQQQLRHAAKKAEIDERRSDSAGGEGRGGGTEKKADSEKGKPSASKRGGDGVEGEKKAEEEEAEIHRKGSAGEQQVEEEEEEKAAATEPKEPRQKKKGKEKEAARRESRISESPPHTTFIITGKLLQEETGFQLLRLLLLVVGCVGLVAATQGPLYAKTAVRLVYGQKWSESRGAMAALQFHSILLPLESLRGLLDAYVLSTSAAAALSLLEQWHLRASLLQLLLLYLAVVTTSEPFQAAAVVASQCLYMLLRIALNLLPIAARLQSQLLQQQQPPQQDSHPLQNQEVFCVSGGPHRVPPASLKMLHALNKGASGVHAFKIEGGLPNCSARPRRVATATPVTTAVTAAAADFPAVGAAAPCLNVASAATGSTTSKTAVRAAAATREGSLPLPTAAAASTTTIIPTAPAAITTLEAAWPAAAAAPASRTAATAAATRQAATRAATRGAALSRLGGEAIKTVAACLTESAAAETEEAGPAVGDATGPSKFSAAVSPAEIVAEAARLQQRWEGPEHAEDKVLQKAKVRAVTLLGGTGRQLCSTCVDHFTSLLQILSLLTETLSTLLPPCPVQLVLPIFIWVVVSGAAVTYLRSVAQPTKHCSVAGKHRVPTSEASAAAAKNQFTAFTTHGGYSPARNATCRDGLPTSVKADAKAALQSYERGDSRSILTSNTEPSNAHTLEEASDTWNTLYGWKAEHVKVVPFLREAKNEAHCAHTLKKSDRSNLLLVPEFFQRKMISFRRTAAATESIRPFQKAGADDMFASRKAVCVKTILAGRMDKSTMDVSDSTQIKSERGPDAWGITDVKQNLLYSVAADDAERSVELDKSGRTREWLSTRAVEDKENSHHLRQAEAVEGTSASQEAEDARGSSSLRNAIGANAVPTFAGCGMLGSSTAQSNGPCSRDSVLAPADRTSSTVDGKSSDKHEFHHQQRAWRPRGCSDEVLTHSRDTLIRRDACKKSTPAGANLQGNVDADKGDLWSGRPHSTPTAHNCFFVVDWAQRVLEKGGCTYVKSSSSFCRTKCKAIEVINGVCSEEIHVHVFPAENRCRSSSAFTSEMCGVSEGSLDCYTNDNDGLDPAQRRRHDMYLRDSYVDFLHAKMSTSCSRISRENACMCVDTATDTINSQIDTRVVGSSNFSLDDSVMEELAVPLPSVGRCVPVWLAEIAVGTFVAVGLFLSLWRPFVRNANMLQRGEKNIARLGESDHLSL